MTCIYHLLQETVSLMVSGRVHNKTKPTRSDKSYFFSLNKDPIYYGSNVQVTDPSS
jgi:hypothetical protein